MAANRTEPEDEIDIGSPFALLKSLFRPSDVKVETVGSDYRGTANPYRRAERRTTEDHRTARGLRRRKDRRSSVCGRRSSRDEIDKPT